MGEPVRIADMARRMAAASGREVDIVFTGLRPGEKLSEERLGQGEHDVRPFHPLISQVPVPPLSAGEVNGLDPDADAESLRRDLARLARGSAHDGVRAFPAQSRAAQDAEADLSGPLYPRAVSH
jgi:FlaA1/EpsC-like NDP-sugar epimerase